MSSSRIEELPEDFEEKVSVAGKRSSSPKMGDQIPSLEQLMAQAESYGKQANGAPQTAGAQMPPDMADIKQYSADEVLAEMNKVPLFMTSLDDTDGPEGGNLQLEALKALAYEGTRAEIAGNFREQGNEAAREKLWKDAREFYDRALETLRMSDEQLLEAKGGEGPTEFEVVELDNEDEKAKEAQILEASHVNRALCNLEMKNYGACLRDCAAVVKVNPKNVKAWYRSATACLALDKIDQAEDACARGLAADTSNAALKTLATKILKRKQYLGDLAKARHEREERQQKEEAALKLALSSRNISIRTTSEPPDMEDAAMSLEEPTNPASTLRIPALLLYPLHEQTDFIKQFAEDESVGQHLQYIMPLPWDEQQIYNPEVVDCYVETTAGGLLKAGKKMALLRILNTGKVQIVDGLLRIYVVPRDKASSWIETFKKRRFRG
ncbi:TPR repeat protein-like protein [Myriangium duriaei CBS 260.36]|uniref:TPR repeat protein-like protein n=1 Tax=Myriangium duriaei CBS 260.36 TaxID=1168546 RepID=A0A9P4JFG2_9PEZI|nr:TPR repeat protein-like protein [Myriangium duriaei CBS 260.36]